MTHSEDLLDLFFSEIAATIRVGKASGVKVVLFGPQSLEKNCYHQNLGSRVCSGSLYKTLFHSTQS